jgi:branched-chain amino acid transport system ATP-binding protein
LAALSDVDFAVREGEILGLIGPNGAGKTTLLNLISGVYKMTRGELFFKGKPLNKLKPHEIAKLGIARTFQIVRSIESMSVKDNVAVGALFGSLDRRRNLKESQKFADEVLERTKLAGKKHSKVSE